MTSTNKRCNSTYIRLYLYTALYMIHCSAVQSVWNDNSAQVILELIGQEERQGRGLFNICQSQPLHQHSTAINVDVGSEGLVLTELINSTFNDEIEWGKDSLGVGCLDCWRYGLIWVGCAECQRHQSEIMESGVMWPGPADGEEYPQYIMILSCQSYLRPTADIQKKE